MILLETIVRRWYAFAFLIPFFWAASAERGWRRALRFLVTAAVVAYIAEYMSTHSSFPYGRYDYLAGTQGDELYVSNVPAFVPITFGIVVWAGRSLAQVGFRALTPGRLVLGGALCAAALDLVIDPMTFRGNDWFLGRLYAFRASGGWFDVPWSNLAGWIGVSAAILWVDELFDYGKPRAVDPIRGPALAAMVSAFMILVALATRHWAIFLAQVVVVGLLALATFRNIGAAAREAEEGPEGAPG